MRRRIFELARRMTPRVSQTERIALVSGTVGLERLALAGTLCKAHLDAYAPRRDYDRRMHAKLGRLHATIDESDILHRRVTPPDHPFWNRAKEMGFFGLIVPKAHGGGELSPTALSTLLQECASISASLPVHVMVPASLGPAELLSHYGTPEQRRHFLPRLARGAIPCFALTSTDAGSDAAGSMTDVATVVDDGEGGVRLSLCCDKRYITLAPVADIVGVAFKIDDPTNRLGALCGRSVHGEITLALLERDAPNLVVGPYTDPLGVGFANGTVVATDTPIDIEKQVIGGVDGLGRGWAHLMEALAAGRGIALPAGAAGSSKALCNASGAYARVRSQFKQPIAAFEGVQEKLAEMAVATYEIDSLVRLMNAILENGERPPILSAILKFRCTELGRRVVNESMDILGGAAICMGPQNFVAPAYLSTPIGITVEGSNTMTRSLLIFGQGLVRSHPHVLGLLNALEADDATAFYQTVGRFSLDVARLLLTPDAHRSDIERVTRFFALSASASLALGGRLKTMEFLSGRYADLLTMLVSYHAVGWNGQHHTTTQDAATIVQRRLLHRMHATCADLAENHPHARVHRALLWKTVGAHRSPDMTDAQRTRLAAQLTTWDTPLRTHFDAHNKSAELHPNVARLHRALRQMPTDPQELRQILRVDLYAHRDGRLLRASYDDRPGAHSGGEEEDQAAHRCEDEDLRRHKRDDCNRRPLHKV